MRLIQNHSRGNTTSEYAIIGLVLVGTCLAGLSYLASELNGQWQTFGTSIEYHPTAKVANSPPGTQTATLPVKGVSLVDPAKLPSVSMEDLSNPVKTISVIEVAGANGATEQLASVLVSRTQDMLAKGLITENQAGELLKLANQGHYLAEGQKLLEEALQSGQASIRFEGKTYDTNKFSLMLGFNDYASGTEIWTLDPDKVGPVLRHYVKQYQDILRSGLLNNPAVQSQVDSLVMQTGALADALVWRTREVVNSASIQNSDTLNATISAYFKENMVENVVRYTKEGLKGSSITSKPDTLSPSSLTHGNSAELCGLGAGQDSGQNCQER